MGIVAGTIAVAARGEADPRMEVSLVIWNNVRTCLAAQAGQGLVQMTDDGARADALQETNRRLSLRPHVSLQVLAFREVSAGLGQRQPVPRTLAARPIIDSHSGDTGQEHHRGWHYRGLQPIFIREGMLRGYVQAFRVLAPRRASEIGRRPGGDKHYLYFKNTILCYSQAVLLMIN